MLGELEALFGTMEFEDNGGLVVASVRWPRRACDLLLDVRTGDEKQPRQAWHVHCADFRASRLIVAWVDEADLTADHPVLLPYTQPHAQLGFHGRPAHSRLVLADLWEAHRAVTDLWHPFEAFFNPVPLVELLASNTGLLAEGPRSLMERYADVLRAHGIEPSLFGERPALRWLDGAWQPEFPNLYAFILGKSFVVGAGFEVQRVEVDALDGFT
jgi:hypothetical protein